MCTVSLHELLAGGGEFQETLERRQTELTWARDRFMLLELTRKADHVLRQYLDDLPAPPLRSLGDWLIAAVAESEDFAVATFNADHFAVFERRGLVLVSGLPRGTTGSA